MNDLLKFTIIITVVVLVTFVVLVCVFTLTKRIEELEKLQNEKVIKGGKK